MNLKSNAQLINYANKIHEARGKYQNDTLFFDEMHTRLMETAIRRNYIRVVAKR